MNSKESAYLPVGKNRINWPLGLLIGFALITVSCMPVRQPVSRELPLPLDQTYSHTGTFQMASPWWYAFQDSELNQIIETALQGNFELNSARFRTLQTVAMLNRTDANRWPEIQLNGAGSTTERSGAGQNEASIQGQSFSLGLAASYEIDLWGRLAAARQVADHNYQASSEDLQALELSIVGEAVVAWYQIAKHRALLRLLGRQVQTNTEYEALLELRFKFGQATMVDIHQQRRQSATIVSQIPIIKREQLLWEQRLMVLLGHSPQQRPEAAHASLPAIPALPKVGLPTELLQSRPDLKAAFHRVKAADREIAVAIADQYPRLRISANLDTQGVKLSDLFDNWLANLAANLVAPLIDGGRLRAEVNRRHAIAEEQFHLYGQTILDALAEVEAALVSEQKQVDHVNSLAIESKQAQLVLENSQRRYELGLTDYLPVLDAVESVQTLERAVLEAKHQRLAYRIALYRALGTKWKSTNRVQKEKKEETR